VAPYQQDLSFALSAARVWRWLSTRIARHAVSATILSFRRSDLSMDSGHSLTRTNKPKSLALRLGCAFITLGVGTASLIGLGKGINYFLVDRPIEQRHQQYIQRLSEVKDREGYDHFVNDFFLDRDAVMFYFGNANPGEVYDHFRIPIPDEEDNGLDEYMASRMRASAPVAAPPSRHLYSGEGPLRRRELVDLLYKKQEEAKAQPF